MARTDGDTWDLASSVGATATMVAAQRALGHREKLIDDPYAEPLVRAVGLDFFTKMLDGELDLTDVDPAFTPRRAAEGMAVRTRFFDQMFLDGAAAGVRQAVILAAGLDARGYRLPWPDGTVGLRGRPARGHRVQDHDAGRSRRRTDGHPPHRGDRPARGLAEGSEGQRLRPDAADRVERRGLLIYLPSEAQDKLFDNITALSAPGSRLATEHVPDLDRLHRRALRADRRSG